MSNLNIDKYLTTNLGNNTKEMSSENGTIEIAIKNVTCESNCEPNKFEDIKNTFSIKNYNINDSNLFAVQEPSLLIDKEKDVENYTFTKSIGFTSDEMIGDNLNILKYRNQKPKEIESTILLQCSNELLDSADEIKIQDLIEHISEPNHMAEDIESNKHSNSNIQDSFKHVSDKISNDIKTFDDGDLISSTIDEQTKKSYTELRDSNDALVNADDTNVDDDVDKDNSYDYDDDVESSDSSSIECANNIHSLSSDEEEKAKKYVPRTKGEFTLSDLPPIEELTLEVPEDIQMIKFGSIMSIVDVLVIVHSEGKMPALDIESILFLDRRIPLGQIFETFGPVKSPWYSIRFNSIKEITKNKFIKLNAAVFYAPQMTNWTKYVFLEELRRIRGSDASWKDNNEPPEGVIDYSDDEQERNVKKAKSQKRNKSPEKPAQNRKNYSNQSWPPSNDGSENSKLCEGRVEGRKKGPNMGETNNFLRSGEYSGSCRQSAVSSSQSNIRYNGEYRASRNGPNQPQNPFQRNYRSNYPNQISTYQNSSEFNLRPRFAISTSNRIGNRSNVDNQSYNFNSPAINQSPQLIGCQNSNSNIRISASETLNSTSYNISNYPQSGGYPNNCFSSPQTVGFNPQFNQQFSSQFNSQFNRIPPPMGLRPSNPPNYSTPPPLPFLNLLSTPMFGRLPIYNDTARNVVDLSRPPPPLPQTKNL